MANRQDSIKNRIRAVMVLACVIVLTATAAAFAIYEVSSFKGELTRHLSTIGAVIADNVRTPLSFENEENAEEILAALKAEPGMEASAVYDKEGNVFVFYPPSLQKDLLPTHPGSGSWIQDGSMISFVSVLQEGKTVGTLYLRVSLKAMYERLARYGTIVAVVLCGSIAGAFALSTVLQKRISGPILALSQAAQKVAERADYSIRAPKLTQDELGTLTDNFNQMLVETQEHHSRLTEQARLLDLSNDAIIVRETNDRIVYWNRGATEIYGWAKEEAVGKVKEELLKTEYPFPRAQVFETLNREGRWQGELVQTRKDGARIHVSTRWALDRGPDGKPANVLISDNDITEQKKAEEALRENEQRFRALGDNIPQLAWMTDPSGGIFWYNKRWYDYTGTTFEEMKGWGWSKVHQPNRLAAVTAKWKEHLKRGENWEDTFQLRGKDGQFRWFLSRAFPIRNSQGQIVRWFGTNTDITEQKMSEEQLERMVSERTLKLQDTIGELEAFSYSVSHDMRSPLRAMQGYAKALQEDYKVVLDETAQNYLQRIQNASNRLDLLIQDVLAYSKVAKGEIDLHRVDLDRLIGEILLSHPELQLPRAEVIVEKPLPAVLGHEAYLTQCVTNLLGNAAKFVRTGEIPRIRIRAEEVDQKVRVWFEDNGIGIDPAHFGRIFEIFGQVYGEKKFGGTGIGLAIVRKAVHRMNGEVGVESEVGQGSRFWIVLEKA